MGHGSWEVNQCIYFHGRLCSCTPEAWSLVATVPPCKTHYCQISKTKVPLNVLELEWTASLALYVEILQKLVFI